MTPLPPGIRNARNMADFEPLPHYRSPAAAPPRPPRRVPRAWLSGPCDKYTPLPGGGWRGVGNCLACLRAWCWRKGPGGGWRAGQEPPDEEPPPRARGNNGGGPVGSPVRCVDTGQVFETARAAADWAGTSQENISTAIRRGHRAGGHGWERA